MIDIKFRGQRSDTKEWVYGSLINNCWFKAGTKEPIPYILDTQAMGDVDCDSELFEELMDKGQVNPETVGQFTGLLDADGKEIYEGDIVRSSKYIGGNYVETIHREYEVVFQGVSFQYKPIPAAMYTVDPIGCEVKIIGNIHETPQNPK